MSVLKFTEAIQSAMLDTSRALRLDGMFGMGSCMAVPLIKEQQWVLIRNFSKWALIRICTLYYTCITAVVFQ